MRTKTVIATLAFILAPISVTAGEFNDHCANGLANYDAMVETDCSVNWKDDKNGKTYCFSSEKSKAEFMKDPAANIKRAEKAFAGLKDE